MLCIVSWRSQGLVMANDPCKATITKKLAWLVKYLVISCHEFSSHFILFSTHFFNIKIPFLFHYLSLIFLLFSYFVSKTIFQNLFLFHFPFISFLFSYFVSTDLQPLLIYFLIAVFIAFTTYRFWISFFFLFLFL